MKSLYIIIAFLIFWGGIKGQNIVPNPSFEIHDSCPTGVTQIDRSTGWCSYGQTPDYFNSCNNNQVSVPGNYAGYQNALTGNAYSGFLTYARFANNIREI